MGTEFITLSRQSGLMSEMQTIANNIANISTTGYRREGVVFSELVHADAGSERSVSVAAARGRHVDLSQGALQPTGGTFDLAIEGEGFFQIETPDGVRLTRAGSFLPNESGDLVTPEGYSVLDEGGGPVFIPPDGDKVSIAPDGTVSVDQRSLARIGVVTPTDPTDLSRESGLLLATSSGTKPVEDSRILQGFVEDSNVNPVLEIARMIEVQRAYELGQGFAEQEHKRLTNVIDTLTR